MDVDVPVDAPIHLRTCCLCSLSAFSNGMWFAIWRPRWNCYGASVFCVGSLPILLLVFASFQTPLKVIAICGVQNLFQYLAAGFAQAIIVDRAGSPRSI